MLCTKVMNVFERNKGKIFLMVALLIIMSAAFYWYSFRPYLVTKECISTSMEIVKELREEKGSGDQTDVRYFFWRCQKEHGLSE